MLFNLRLVYLKLDLKNYERILRKIAANDPDNLGDTTMADPTVVESLVQNRQNKG